MERRNNNSGELCQMEMLCGSHMLPKGMMERTDVKFCRLYDNFNEKILNFEFNLKIINTTINLMKFNGILVYFSKNIFKLFS